ncbi:hypothetical protein GP475_08120 [Corynebacterium poyangense]|uniref:Uncharacterized protein n=1 Tax=Corynebacterium poyangense TaxID=2684405 RepID=A0A7H0SPY4_9CORY|nr:hypothetical protein [Corynebacterium poyangense]MBZ8178465.1 hypothetical protein [Corynebacterium poyangense]QNQ90609.1 hypothetical protein GP475_08120 [Corynebacterium poyangense]
MKISMTLSLNDLTLAELSAFSEAAYRNGADPDTIISYDPDHHTLSLESDNLGTQDETDIAKDPTPSPRPPQGEWPIPKDVGEQVVNGVIDFLTGHRKPPEGGYGSFRQ